MAMDPKLKDTLIQEYKDANPTSENSIEIVQEIADNHELTVNQVRMVLVTAGVYVKKDPAKAAPGGAGAKEGTGAKRVSKESSIAALRAKIEAAGKPVDDEILEKLTGKAAVYFASLF